MSEPDPSLPFVPEFRAEKVIAIHRDDGWTCAIGPCRVVVGHDYDAMEEHLYNAHRRHPESK